MTIIETIKIKMELLNKKFNDRAKQSQTQLKKLNSQVARGITLAAKSSAVDKRKKERTKTLAEQQYKFGQVMGMSMERFKAFNQQGYKFNTLGGRIANITRKMTHGLRGFRMEMLGVMFFGMSLTRIMSGLFSKSMEWTGVMEILSAALGLLFLPMGMLLLDWALKFLDWVGGLSEEQKKLIGVITLVVGVFGVFLTILGTLALGIGSIILAFSSLFSPIGMLIIALGGLAIAAAIASIFKDTGDASDELQGKLISFGVPPEVFDAIKNKIVSLFSSIKKIITDKMPGIKAEFKTKLDELIMSIEEKGASFIAAGRTIANYLMVGVVSYIKENPFMVVGAMIGAWFGGPVGAMIGSAIGLLFGKLDFSQISGVVDKGKQLLDGFLYGLDKNIYIIGDAVVLIIEELGKWIGKNAPKILKLGLMFAGYLAEGIAKGVLGALDSLLEWVPGYKKVRSSVNNSRFNPGSHKNDFIWRAGQGAVSINPNDNLVGFKGAPPSLGNSSGQSINQTITINATVSNDYDVRKLADQLNRYWVSDINKMAKSK